MAFRRDMGPPVPQVTGRGFEFDPGLIEVPQLPVEAVPDAPTKFEKALKFLRNPALQDILGLKPKQRQMLQSPGIGVHKPIVTAAPVSSGPVSFAGPFQGGGR